MGGNISRSHCPLQYFERSTCDHNEVGSASIRHPSLLCQGYEVAKYIHGDSTATTTSTLTSFTPEELKVDIIDSVHSRGTQNNKRSRTIASKVELRSIKLGDLTIEAYFQKIESFATILTMLGSPVSSEYVVTYALEGLPDKYDHVCGIISHPETFLDLKMARYVLTTEETRPGF
ncbi:hypothetical protein Tco_0739999 [Tanacetum coccineum]